MRLFRLNPTGLVWVALLFMAGGLEGCSSGPPPGPDSKLIQQDAEKGMRDLEREENQHNQTNR